MVDELVEEHWAFARSCSRRFFPRHPELREETGLLLFEIATEYIELEEREQPFQLYLYVRLHARMIDRYRQLYGRSEQMRLVKRMIRHPEKLVVDEYDGEVVNTKTVKCTRDDILQAENRIFVEQVKGRLTDIERFIHAAYADGRTLREIGEILGVTESRVCQIRRKSQRRMEEWLR